MNHIDKMYKKIVNIEIQGATNVCEAVLMTLKKIAADRKAKDARALIKKLHQAGHYLIRARATEPMAVNAVRFIDFHLDRHRDLSVAKLRVLISRAIGSFLFDLSNNRKIIADQGDGLIRRGDNIFTHCHSSTVIDILKHAHKSKKKIRVFNTETRPLFQGRTTSKDLVKAGISNTQVVDSAGPFFVSNFSTGYNMDILILGCDAISRSGDAVNKIGSFGLALAARQSNIPLYVATQSLKLDVGAAHLENLELEKRMAREVWPTAPEGLKIVNYAFDIIPAAYISGYITELGIIRPRYLAKRVFKKYKFLKL
ncbi:MAG: translation initiation factor eIF-2B [Patescibacteria group bacterium]